MFMDKVMLRFVYTVLLTVLMAHHARAQDTQEERGYRHGV